MNNLRETMLKELEVSDLALFEKIKNNKRPDPIDLWGLSEERFIEWRKLNDFPILLMHFDKTLTLFKDWKKEFNLTNELIIDSGFITPFLEKKKLSKDKKLYLIRQTGNEINTTVVSYSKISGEKSDFGVTFTYEIILEFTSYLDWLESKGKHQKILYINSRHAPDTDSERVFIHADVYAAKTDFELLKMGGIEIPVNGFRILFRGKKLEFVNLCGLKLSGEIHFGELGNLSCSYCACDNWKATDFNMPTLEFEHCTIGNLSLKNSLIQQWQFYNCGVSGDFVNSKLANVRIFGGQFSPIMQDCSLFEVNIEDDSAIEDNNYYAYRTFKKIYANQGDDDKAKDYFIKENEYLRKKAKGWRFLTKSLSYFYWEYGRKPHRIVYLSIAIIIVFGFVYWINKDLIALNSTKITDIGLWDSLYFSTTTFTTLGYGDLSPLSWLRIFTSVEAFLGVVNMGFLIAGYSNNKY